MPKSPERLLDASREREAPRVAVVARRDEFFATFAALALCRSSFLAFVFAFGAARLLAARRFFAAALRRDACFLAIDGTPLPAVWNVLRRATESP
jgi:hypothetical protein